MAGSDGLVEIDVLGPVRARVGDEVVDPGPRRHREVLATLAVDAGVTISVDALLERVWAGQAVAPSTLHAIISRLRGRLGEGVIVTEPGGYRLALDRERVDAVRFTGLLARARAAEDAEAARELVREALGLWRGPALDDVRTLGAETEALRLEAARLAAEDLLAELDLELGAHAEVADRLPQLVDRHPLRESLRASLMLALYRSGRQVEALARYDEARAALADELGLDPGPALQRLHARILRQDADLQAAAPLAPPTAAAPATSMVGRDGPLRELRAALDLAVSGPASVVTVSGEAGIGKTRLVEEALHAPPGDPLVVWGRCWETDGAPAYWPWEQALTALAEALPGDGADVLLTGRAAPAALLLPSHDRAVTLPTGAPDVARTRLHEAVVALLSAVSTTRPVVVVLEDMQWADAESVELAEHVALAVRSARLALVVTVRDPDPAATDVLGALARAPRERRLALSGLDVDEVGELVARRIGAPVDPGVAEALRARTEGNPFYLDELTRLLGEERQASGRADVPVPSGVRAVLERRLRRLPDAEREVLETASVIGRSFPVGVLAEVLDRPRFDVAGVLDRAVTSGLLAPELARGEQRFAHALVQETIAASLGPQRRNALHARVAVVLEAHGAAGEARVAALAHHHHEAGAAGDPAAGVTWLLRAAADAEARLALREAERLTRQALGLVELLPAAHRSSPELEVRVRLGSLVTLRSGYNDVEVAEHRRTALALAEEVGATQHLLSALWGTWGNALVSGDLPAALTACERLAAGADRTGDPLLALAARAALGQTQWHQGRFGDAAAVLEQAALLADAEGDDLPLDLFLQHPGVQARGWWSVALALRGEVDASDQVAADATAVAERLDHPFTRTYTDILEGLRLLWLHRPVGAAERSARALAAAQEHGFVQLAAFALVPAGGAAARLGDPVAGESLLRQALAAFGSLPSGHMFGHLMLGLLAEARLLAGDPDDALDLVDRAIEDSARTGESFHLVELHLLRARVQTQRGYDDDADLAAARAVAREQGVLVVPTR